MTTKRMEEINRKTRILRSLRALECVHEIATREQVTDSYVGLVANKAHIPRCNHINRGRKCIKPNDLPT